MSEDLIIKHCSPTLAGLKTANLFTCVYAQKQDVERYTQEFNRRFSHKGVKMQPLGYGKKRALIYVFRPTQLEKDLSDPQARSILASMGYKSFDSKSCLNRLKSRVKKCPEFPHEIGLCPPRKNRQKTYAKSRMKRMTNIRESCSIRPHLFHGSLDNEPLKV